MKKFTSNQVWKVFLIFINVKVALQTLFHKDFIEKVNFLTLRNDENLYNPDVPKMYTILIP